MNYTFRFGPEAIWFLVTSVATFVLQMIVAQGAVPPTDMRAWLISLGAGAARALLGALLALPAGTKGFSAS